MQYSVLVLGRHSLFGMTECTVLGYCTVFRFLSPGPYRFLKAVSFSSASGGRGGVTYCMTDSGRKFLGDTKVRRGEAYGTLILRCLLDTRAQGDTVQSIAAGPPC